jgi:hypothetical protein
MSFSLQLLPADLFFLLLLPVTAFAGEEIRFRVASLRFNPTPTAAQLQQQAAAAAAAAAAADGGQPPPAAPTVHSPLEVLGDMDGDGLGLTCWWQPGAEEEPAAS